MGVCLPSASVNYYNAHRSYITFPFSRRTLLLFNLVLPSSQLFKEVPVNKWCKFMNYHLSLWTTTYSYELPPILMNYHLSLWTTTYPYENPYFTPLSSIFIVDFKQINICLLARQSIFEIFRFFLHTNVVKEIELSLNQDFSHKYNCFLNS